MQYTLSATLDCAVHTQCHSRLCSTHSVPLYTVQYTLSATLDCAVHTRADYVHINGHDRTIAVILAKHFMELSDDGSVVIRNMLEHFKNFLIILTVSTNYIFVHLLDNKVF